MNDEKKPKKNMCSLSCNTSVYHDDKVREHAAKTGMRLSRVVSIALHNELERDNPFEYDLTLPDKDEFIDNAYGDEGGKFLAYMKTIKTGLGLDMIVMLRYDMGISDKKALLTVFADCLDCGLIESYTPVAREGYPVFPPGYLYYRIPKEKGHETSRKKVKKVSRYDRYLKLHKEFGKEA